jgi:DNA-binding CsgD family transcriptional regulator
MGANFARARRDVIRLAHSGLDWVTLATQASSAVARVMPFQHTCWHTMDPATLMMTGAFAQNLSEEPRLGYHEYAIPDVNKWAFLATRPRPVGVLSVATNGNPSTSPRYRGLLVPRGIGDELRASLVGDSMCWAALGFYRQRGAGVFTDDEARFVASLTGHLAAGIRKAMLLAAATPEFTLEGPGLILFDEHDEVEAITPAAQLWLDEVIEARIDAVPRLLPSAVCAVAAAARRSGDALDAPSAVPRNRVYTRSGRWLLLHGIRLEGAAGSRTAVILEPARPIDIAPLIAQAYGLTSRERQVTRLCLQGMSTTGIAQSLGISPHTVKDHLKTIFDKVDVHSRQELVARLFNERYSQDARDDEPVDSRRGDGPARVSTTTPAWD